MRCGGSQMLLAVAAVVAQCCTGQEVLGEVSDLPDPVELSTAAGKLSGVVRSPGAVWMQVAVTAAQLQDGDVLVVLDEEGTVVEEVTATDTEALPYWVSVTGPTLRVQLKQQEGSTHEASATLGMMFSEVPQEEEEARRAAGLAICKKDQKRDAVCFKGSNPTVFATSSAVARIAMPCKPGSKKMCTCTAWRVSPKNDTMVTNNHCLQSQEQLPPAKVFFGFQAPWCGGGDAMKGVVTVRPRKLLITGSGLDYTLFTVWGAHKIEKFGALELDNRNAGAQEWIYVPQHPGGKRKKLAVKDDDGECTVREEGDNWIHYECDTEKGSSGAPVLSRKDHKVVGLNFGSTDCKNFAYKSSRLHEKLSAFLYGEAGEMVVDREA